MCIRDSGRSEFINSGAAGHATLQFQSLSGGSANTGQATISAFNESSGSKNTALTFGTRQNSDATVRERLRIHSTGQMQIGGTTLINTDPLLTLGQSASSVGNQFHLVNDGSADLKQIFISAGKASRHVGIDVSTNNFFVGRDSVDSDLVITSTGKVGINETSPGTYLHVKGTGEILRLETTASGGGQCFIDFDDETATRASIGLRGSSSDTLTIAALNSGLRFDVQNANSALLINSNGCLQHTTASGVSYFTGSSEYIIGSTTSSPPSGGYESSLQVHTSKTRSAFTLAASVSYTHLTLPTKRIV